MSCVGVVFLTSVRYNISYACSDEEAGAKHNRATDVQGNTYPQFGI